MGGGFFAPRVDGMFEEKRAIANRTRYKFDVTCTVQTEGFMAGIGSGLPDSTKSVCYIQSTDFIVCFYYASQTSKKDSFQFKEIFFTEYFIVILTVLCNKISN